MGDHLGFLKIQFVAKYQKIEGGPLEIFKKFRKKLNRFSAEKCIRGTLWAFPTSIQLQNLKKMKGEPFGDTDKFSKKSLTKRGRRKSHDAEKLEKGGHFCSVAVSEYF